jgi:hypothetical protein
LQVTLANAVITAAKIAERDAFITLLPIFVLPYLRFPSPARTSIS